MVKAMLICQGFQFASDLSDGNASVQPDLCITLFKINFETVAVKSFDHFLSADCAYLKKQKFYYYD